MGVGVTLLADRALAPEILGATDDVGDDLLRPSAMTLLFHGLHGRLLADALGGERLIVGYPYRHLGLGLPLQQRPQHEDTVADTRGLCSDALCMAL